MNRDSRRKFASHYLPEDIGPITPSQWLDMNRPLRPSDTPEGQLMVAVLAQALIDFREGTLLQRRSAQNWFLRRGEGFEAICELLGVDPDRVRTAVL
jgi:hypothetical protein